MAVNKKKHQTHQTTNQNQNMKPKKTPEISLVPVCQTVE